MTDGERKIWFDQSGWKAFDLPRMNKDAVLKFNHSVLSVLTYCRQLGEREASAEKVELPADWPATQAILRGRCGRFNDCGKRR